MNPKEIKIIFMGTPHFAAVVLKCLIAARYNVVSVFTQPDKKAGRKQAIKKSPVKELAEENSIPVFELHSLERGNAVEEIAKTRPDLIIVAAYGKILPKAILEIPKYGSINVHASLLPKFRGASPVQEAILAGEKKTGVTLMLMSEKLDAGEIINQEKTAIQRNDNVLTLTEKLASLGGKSLIETLPLWIDGMIKATAQSEKEATYCRTIKKEDGKIDWKKPAEIIWRKWKAYAPWPGIYTFWEEGGRKKRLKIIGIKIARNAASSEKTGKVVEYKREIGVQTGQGIIILKKVQLEGKREISAAEFARGRKDFIGSIFG